MSGKEPPSEFDFVMEVGGGLGNQIWHTLLGRSIEKKGKKVLFDFHNVLHSNSTHGENFMASLGCSLEFKSFISWRQRLLFGMRQLAGTDHLLQSHWPSFHESLAREALDLDALFRLPKGTRLRGAFQYLSLLEGSVIEAMKQEIRRQASLLDPSLLFQLQSANVGVIHVRGGDYAQSPHLGLLDTRAYTAAQEELQNLTGREIDRYFVFTDDVAHSQSVLPTTGNYVYISGREMSGFEALLCLSQARNLILANSSLSYWAGAFSDDIVLAPNPFFAKNYFPPENFLASWGKYESSFEAQ